VKTWDIYKFVSQNGSGLRALVWWMLTRWSLRFENLRKAIFDTTRDNYEMQGLLITHLNQALRDSGCCGIQNFYTIST